MTLSGEDIGTLMLSETIEKNSVLNLYGAQIALMSLLYKLNIVSMRRVSISHASMMIRSTFGTQKPPPYSVPLTSLSLNQEYLQFCPKRMGDAEFKR